MAIFPPSVREQLLDLAQDESLSEPLAQAQVRIIVDMIASMTERQAFDIYHRLTGAVMGSVTERLF